MGFKRLIKKSILGGGNLITGHIGDAIVKKVTTGRSFRDCLKESLDETIKEDMPVSKHIYQAGKSDGIKQGTAEQAKKDEAKFRKQNEEHERDRTEWQKKKDEYEDLLNDIENG